jgi:hypothetical protein
VRNGLVRQLEKVLAFKDGMLTAGSDKREQMGYG